MLEWPSPSGARPCLFLFAAQLFNKDAEWGLDLLARLLEGQDRAAVKANPAPAVFIAEALELCLAKRYRVPEALAESFRRLSLDAIEDEIEVQARQALGLCLGRLGDPRIAGLRDADAYVEVPAGTYPYGEEKGGTVEIEAPFLHRPLSGHQQSVPGLSRRRRLWQSGLVVGRRLGLATGGRGHRAAVLARPALEWSQPAGGRRQLLRGRGLLGLGGRSAAARTGMGGRRPRPGRLRVPLVRRLGGRDLQHQRGRTWHDLAGRALSSFPPGATKPRGSGW